MCLHCHARHRFSFWEQGIIVFCILITIALSVSRAVSPKKPDYVRYNEDGVVQYRETYPSDSTQINFTYNKDGSVARREVIEKGSRNERTKTWAYDGADKLLSEQYNYYNNRGALIHSDCFNGSGELVRVFVYFDDEGTVVEFDGHGKYIKTESTYDPTLPVPINLRGQPGKPGKSNQKDR